MQQSYHSLSRRWESKSYLQGMRVLYTRALLGELAGAYILPDQEVLGSGGGGHCGKRMMVSMQCIEVAI